jgi:UDP-3-O-[3-hydroxymyristoyl] glucosamine N-acyltransferase
MADNKKMPPAFQGRGDGARWSLAGEYDAASIVGDIEKVYHMEGPERRVRSVSSLFAAGESDLAFCAYDGDKGASYVSSSKAGIILCRNTLRGRVSNPGSQLVFLENPRFVFVHFANRARASPRGGGARQRSISSAAVVAQSAQIGANCYVGPFTSIGEGVVIGDNVVIEGRATLQNCVIGDGCVVQNGVSIGADGFAYERDPEGGLERFPHFAGVVIGNNVEICANTSIVRGSLTDTRIEDGARLDALVHVAHNVQVGRNCQLAAGTIIGGSARLGASCWTGLNSTIKNGIRVGDGVLVAAGACVIADVPDGDIVAGVPAKSIKQKVTSSELYIMTGTKASSSSPPLPAASSATTYSPRHYEKGENRG